MTLTQEKYTPIPDAVYPTQIEENYAAAKWVAAHGAEIGVDGSRLAVAGDSVGGRAYLRSGVRPAPAVFIRELTLTA